MDTFPPAKERLQAGIGRLSIGGKLMYGGKSLIDTDTKIAFARQFADLLRENARLQGEVHALGGILCSAVLHWEVPRARSISLKQMRNTPEYRTVDEQNAEQIPRLERSANIREVRQTLANQIRPTV
jgi:hypothetical protein